MNPFIENLNQFGGQFLNFAWPMLWQSSLLIAFVFALDFFLARKIRASVRYALWLAVLVKLILPPTFASPTGAAWWLFQDKTEIKIPAAKNYTVTYDNAMPPMDFIPQNIPMPAPLPPKLNSAGWMLLAAVVVSAGLLLWLAIRWWQVARKVRNAKVSEELSDALAEARQLAGLRSQAKLKLVEGRMSPAVCGLFRPVILLPRALAEKLSPPQMRAVLLHEIFHLRRKDVWVNCAQALLQIFYWWHPLLWFANARIRRVREEAVDDAVMLALRDEAENYAPTLLEVAKLAFHRPLMSLGLVGIMESRSALRQRIERLVDFRAPKKAGLTFMSLCVIFVFSAVALPMGEAPSPADGQISPATASAPIVAVAPKPVVAGKAPVKTVLITTHFYWMDDAQTTKVISDPTLGFSAGDSPWPLSPEKLNQLVSNLKSAGISDFGGPRAGAIDGERAEISISKGTNNIIDLDCAPHIVDGFVNLTVHGKVGEGVRFSITNQSVENRGGLVIQAKNADAQVESNLLAVINVQIINPTNFSRKISQTNEEQLVQDGKLLYEMGKLGEAEIKFKAALALDANNATAKYYLGLLQTNAPQTLKLINPRAGRQAIESKLNRIRLDHMAFEAMPLGEVIRTLSVEAIQNDPDRQGINFLINNIHPVLAPKIDPSTGLPAATNAAPYFDLRVLPITISPALTNITLGDVLDAIVKAAPKPIHYSVEDYAIVFSPKGPDVPQLYSRTFRVDANTFAAALKKATNSQTNDVPEMTKSFFKSLGADLDSPGNAIFYNDRLGELFVRATEADLDKIGPAILTLNNPTNLYTRTFKVDPNTFFTAFRKTTGVQTTNDEEVPIIAQNFFKTLGVDLTTPGKSIFYGDRLGELFVRATEADLDKIGPAILTLNNPTNLYTRTFRVDANAFAAALQKATGLQTDNVSEMAKSFFKSLGADLTAPGKSVFFNDRLDMLFVRATDSDLDTIERVIQALNQVTPQIHIKARFVEVSEGSAANFWNLQNPTNSSTDKFTGILTDANVKAALSELESLKGFVTLAEPNMVTSSGRQTQMRETHVINLLTGYSYHEFGTNSTITPQSENFESGPVLDVTAYVLSDGYTINLNTTASLTNFWGYAEIPKNEAMHSITNSAGVPVHLPQVRPVFQTNSLSAHVNLWDGQTVVLGGMATTNTITTTDEVPLLGDLPVLGSLFRSENKKVTINEMLIFITATIIDPAGNRIHSDDEMPFAQKGVPPQPPPVK